MKIFDMHIHGKNTPQDPEALISAWREAGVFGGCVFSAPPKEQQISSGYLGGGSTYEERIAEVRSWTRGYEDRIFPVMWIHPYEENIIENVRRAVKDGVVAFKMSCTNYYIYEERPMAVLREIAKLGVPVIFHTGILWDGKVSSNYNRPLNFEALLDIEGIRFSMGHCSWPWIDECIALYGKFLNALTKGKRVEMFFDITPGTPEIYRRELLTKLYTVGYNMGDNIMFGTDSRADAWRPEWASNWLKIDGEILDDLGISLEYREKLYSKNLMRFLGKGGEGATIEAPVPDNSHIWTAVNPEVKTIIEKWYNKLGIPSIYNAEFKRALEEINISDAINIETYDKTSENGKRNFLSYLFLCEGLEEKYKAKGIPEKILLDTLSDIPVWCATWSYIKGGLYLGELSWLARHLGMKLFRLGRLQFCMADAEHDIPKYGVMCGDPVIEVHIPEGEKLDLAACEESVNAAREFFKTYFPEYDYKCFTCHSWLLDDTLKNYLPENSGIVRFGDMFDKVENEQSDAILKYLFRWDTTSLTLKYATPTSSLGEKVKKAHLGGVKFYETLGVIER
ncbi:MAG: amidohydrolase family protein [Clostridia bacterium]|nr:amidohydrolase family protein [Clostridia bacterium]MBR3714346.1 amidohydrolase family protein [Clostridia bacterium]